MSDIHKHRDGYKNNNKDFIDNELLNIFVEIITNKNFNQAVFLCKNI